MGALSVIHSGVDFNAPQIKLIKDTVAKDTNNEEFNLFMEVAKRSGLDPFRKQIHAVVYGKKAKDQSKRKMSIITGIDGFRSIAARSGRYRPDENEAEYEYDQELKGPLNPLGLVKATVTINISDDAGSWHPVRGWAYWDEFAAIKDEMGENDQGRWAKTGNQTLDGNWPKMPRVMLAKCAEAQAIRKAFPEQTSGIYEAAELDRERVIELTATEVVGAFEEENRIARLGMTNSVILRLHPTGNLESIQIGKVYDRVVEASADWGLHQLDTFLQGNQPSLREFWARAKTDALELKAHLDSVRAKLVAAAKAEADAAAETEKAEA